MKYFAPIIFLFILFGSCTKEAQYQPKSYPFVVTEAVGTGSDGPVFSADLIETGNIEIISYGFVWDTLPDPNLSNNKIEFLGQPEKGPYSYTVSANISGDKTYFVKSFVLTYVYLAYGNQETFSGISSLPPVITGFDPTFGSVGTKVTLSGENFASNYSANTVMFGDLMVQVDSVSSDRLFVTIPQFYEAKKVHISVSNDAGTSLSDDLFELRYPWSQKNDFNKTGPNSASFSIQDKGYFIKRESSDFYRYHAETDSWDIHGDLPEYSGDKPLGVNANNKGYVMLKDHFWEFDPSTETWTQKADYSGTFYQDLRYMFSMSIDGKVYVGNCYGNYELWEYDPSTDAWQRRADFIDFHDQSSPVWGHFSFSLTDKGYLGLSKTAFAFNSFWEYDPTTDSWKEKESVLPSSAYSKYSCFVIGEEAYVGLGENFKYSDGYVSNKMWKYDLENDAWIQQHDCPVGAAIYANFSINNKGYSVTGWGAYNDKLDEVWEFDPNQNK